MASKRDRQHKMRIGITMGSPNGEGPGMIVNTFKEKSILEFFTPVIFAPAELLEEAAKQLKVTPGFHLIKEVSQIKAGEINVIQTENVEVNAETSEKEQFASSLRSVDIAADTLKNGDLDALVLAPMTWSSDENQPKDEESFLNSKFNEKALKILTAGNMLLAFSDNDHNIKDQIKTLDKTLRQDFWVEKPKIAVLNTNGTQDADLMTAVKEVYEGDLLAFGPFKFSDFYENGKYRFYDAALTTDAAAVKVFDKLALEEKTFFYAHLPEIITAPEYTKDSQSSKVADGEGFGIQEAIFTAIDLVKRRWEQLELLENKLEVTEHHFGPERHNGFK